MSVTAVIADATGCSPAQIYQLGKTDANGVVRTALPYGQWTLKAGTDVLTAGLSTSAAGIVYVPEGTEP